MSLSETAEGTACKNCKTIFQGKYCPNCSQKADTHRLTTKHFVHEFLHALTHTDKGIIFLIKELFIRPGKVCREYIEGKRKRYFNPITFLLITLALQIYVAKKTDIFGNFLESSQKFFQEMAKDNPKGRDASTKTMEAVKAQNPKVMENSKLITFLFIPVLALLTWMLFKKSGFNFAENLVFQILVQGQLNVYFLIFCVLPFVIYPPIVIVIVYLYFVIWWIYSFIAYKQFYQQRWWLTIGKGIVIQTLYVVLVQRVTQVIIAYL